MKKQGPTAAITNPPAWLLISAFVLGSAVPTAVGAVLHVYFASQLVEVRSPSGIAGVVVCLVFGTATVGALAVGVKAIVFRDVESAKFLALLTGVAAILTGIGLAYDSSITPGWTWKQVGIASLVVYYLLTAFVIHARLAALLASESTLGSTASSKSRST